MYRTVLNEMIVPRAELLITHVKGLEGDLELVPKKRNVLFSSLCCYSDDKSLVGCCKYSSISIFLHLLISSTNNYKFCSVLSTTFQL